MRLSEAIRLGSLLVSKPKGMDISSCAIAMANLANGRRTTPNYPGDTTGYKNIGKDYDWIYSLITACPKCGKRLEDYACIYHPFDAHVMTDKTMTIEQLADWIDSIDPTPREAECPETVQGLVPTFA